MLQQTQVKTVIPYFHRWMERFPELSSLAAAPEDEVMKHWAGLGYYARARNILKTAQICMQDHAGSLPRESDALETLPGIGRSTAAAIVAQAHGVPAPILDANVKRVLARFHGITEPIDTAATLSRLWDLADTHTPQQRVADYTQAIMDLGATLCTARVPQCDACPLQGCQAHAQNMVSSIPRKKPKRTRPERRAQMLVAVDSQNRVLIEKRLPSGIWGGLWALPHSEHHELFDHRLAEAAAISHGFTHFRLHLTPFLVQSHIQTAAIADTESTRWISADEFPEYGFPKPIHFFLKRFFEDKIQWQEPCNA